MVDKAERRISGLRPGVDFSTEEGRAFLQDRLHLFARWILIVASAFYVVANLPYDAVAGQSFDWRQEWFGPEELLNLAIVALAAVMFLATGGRDRGHRALTNLDAVTSTAINAAAAGMVIDLVYNHGEIHQVFSVLLACTNLLLARAIVVPSAMTRTLVVTALSFAPLVVITFATTLASEGFTARTAWTVSVATLMWAAIATGSATVASRILFDLRGRVRGIEKLGHYQLVDKIGEGAMGVVYRAHHALLRRPTAVKLLGPGRSSEIDLRRFEREVQMTSRLTHPNTVAVYDFGHTPDGVFYYAMELLDGITLEALVHLDGPQPPARVIHILRQVCGALAEAHEVGLIHRDVKPANIMLCERGHKPDVVKVLDFGLVKAVGGDGRDPALSHEGMVVGTPLYMSPEAIEDPAAIDHRSDLYALGAVGYWLVTGAPVFEAKTVVSMCSKHLLEVPASLGGRLGAAVPGDLERIILDCLEKRPERRPQSALALAERLAECGDAGGWTTAQATAWWNRYRERAEPSSAVAADGATTALEVDLGERIRAGRWINR